MFHDILLAIWFITPIAYANMAPLFAAAIPGLKHWNAPLDFGLKLRGRPLLGSHKTWRGLIAGMLLATLVLWIEQLLARHFSWAASVGHEIHYATLPTLLLGPLLGFGALAGDAVESCFKRQLGRKSGESWLPFDQLDFIIGGLVASLAVVRLRPAVYGWILILGIGGHLLGSYGGWLMGLKEKPI